jgi:hypothetical protein|tara:strand:+ start:261 stop:749 length:489 start_codon:yes stop_codon:yes gene_type:complete
MNDSIYDDMALEQMAKKQFGMDIDVDKVIVRRVPVSRTARATVFLTTKKQLLCCIVAQSNLSLGDVKKMVTRMGLRAELYIPPKNQPDYFDAIGREHFRKVFPGLGPVSANDLTYYRTLAPYNPALVLIQEIPQGEIRQFDTDAHGQWRTAAKFAYRRIKTS